MAKANVILLNSILWNLREITKLADIIKKHCGDVDCTSWRYPLTSCSELEIFKLLQNNRNLDNYTYVLELTYDRILYVFNLMIKYLESTDSMEKFRPDKSIHRPKTLSLASVLYMIWDRIKAHVSNVSEMASEDKAVEDCGDSVQIKASKSSTFTQSEVCSISVCSCCEMVQQFVTQLVLEMENILENSEYPSAMSAERKLMKESLVEMTNWSAMSRWLNAITKDFKTLSEVAVQATISSRQLKHRLDTGEQQMRSKIEQHEEDNKKMDARVRELKKEIDDLAKDKIKLRDEIKSKITQISSITSNFENKIAALKKSHEDKISKKKEKELKKQNEKELEWKRKVECEREKRLETEAQNEELMETICRLGEDFDKLKVKTNEEKTMYESRCKELEDKIEKMLQEKKSLEETVSDKQKVIEEYTTRMLEAYPELSGDPKSKYKASGNPRIDMENQIEANKLRIGMLQAENDQLNKTLEKIKAMKG